jgi:hypothetical protein
VADLARRQLASWTPHVVHDDHLVEGSRNRLTGSHIIS